MTDRIPLTLLPLELRGLTGGNVPAYRVAYTAAVDGRIPAKRGDNGRWTVSRADLPKIAAALGCTASAIAA